MGLGILPPPGVAPPKAPDVQDFTSSGTWTKPDGARLVYAELIGAGGCGSATNQGGGGGGYACQLFDADDLGATESVTVGAGTSSGGANGGSSSFSYVTAPGGGPIHGGGTNRTAGGAGTDFVAGDYAGGDGNNTGSGNGSASKFGGGGGAASGTGGLGGTLASTYGRLQAGNGRDASSGTAGIGGGSQKGKPSGPGAVRITTYF